MADAEKGWASFGPDATFSAIANWLTANASVIDGVFATAPALYQIDLREYMSRQHPDIEGQRINPKLKIVYVATEDAFVVRDERVVPVAHFEAAVGEAATNLKRHCVIRNDLLFQETLRLTIWRGNGAFGVLRYAQLNESLRAPAFETAEQYFVWLRKGNRYFGQRLEIRLWGVYIPEFLAESGAHLTELLASPTTLLTSPEITPGRNTGYIALYQMKRPPSRVETSQATISAIYEGEHEAARVALAQAGM